MIFVGSTLMKCKEQGCTGTIYCIPSELLIKIRYIERQLDYNFNVDEIVERYINNVSAELLRIIVFEIKVRVNNTHIDLVISSQPYLVTKIDIGIDQLIYQAKYLLKNRVDLCSFDIDKEGL